MCEEGFFAVERTAAGGAGESRGGAVSSGVAGEKAGRGVGASAEVTGESIGKEGLQLVRVGNAGQVHILVMADSAKTVLSAAICSTSFDCPL